jgi:hypothetical protein
VQHRSRDNAFWRVNGAGSNGNGTWTSLSLFHVVLSDTESRYTILINSQKLLQALPLHTPTHEAQTSEERKCSSKADSHVACRAVNSHMPCRPPAMLRQCRVLRESPRGSRKHPNCYSSSLTDRLFFCSVLLGLFTFVGTDRCEEGWYASDNSLRGTSRGSRKKPNASR